MYIQLVMNHPLCMSNFSPLFRSIAYCLNLKLNCKPLLQGILYQCIRNAQDANYFKAAIALTYFQCILVYIYFTSETKQQNCSFIILTSHTNILRALGAHYLIQMFYE